MQRVLFIILFGSMSLLRGANLPNPDDNKDGFPAEFTSKDTTENVHTPTNDSSEEPTCPSAPTAQRTRTLPQLSQFPIFAPTQLQNSPQIIPLQSSVIQLQNNPQIIIPLQNSSTQLRNGIQVIPLQNTLRTGATIINTGSFVSMDIESDDEMYNAEYESDDSSFSSSSAPNIHALFRRMSLSDNESSAEPEDMIEDEILSTSDTSDFAYSTDDDEDFPAENEDTSSPNFESNEPARKYRRID